MSSLNTRRRHRTLLTVLGLVWLGSCTATPVTDSEPIPVIVELFTSEACLSCPPADELLIELAERSPVPGVQVIPLSAHVEYWNSSWEDPFSSVAFTDRQRTYHPVLGRSALFTPEMVVDGRMQFVGSQRMLAEHALERAAQVPKVAIELDILDEPEGGPARVGISLLDMAPVRLEEHLVLWVAVTEVGLETAVTRGENAMRRLRHAAVVRSLEPVATLTAPHPDDFTTVAELTLAPDWHRDRVRVVAFVQERESRHIRGAARIPLR